MLHNELIREFPCDGELFPIGEGSAGAVHRLCCARCGTEISYMPDCAWVVVVLPGMRLELKT